MSGDPVRVLRVLEPVIKEAKRRGEISPSLWLEYMDILHSICSRCGVRYKATRHKYLCTDCHMEQNKEMWG